jgi:hypothetical protein
LVDAVVLGGLTFFAAWDPVCQSQDTVPAFVVPDALDAALELLDDDEVFVRSTMKTSAEPGGMVEPWPFG